MSTASATSHRRRAARLLVEDWVAILVIGAGAVLRSVGALGGTWYNDDWGVLFSVSQRRFVPSELVLVFGGHFSPVQFALYRLLYSVVPASYPAAALTASVLYALGAGLVYLVLRRLFGARPTVVVLLVWFVFSTMTLSSSFWVNVAFYLLPFQIAFAATLLLFLRYLEHPSPRRRLWVVVGLIGALSSFEKGVLIPFALFALAAWFPLVSPRAVGARVALLAHRVLWIVLGAVLALYAAGYAVLVATGHTTPSGVTAFTARARDVGSLAVDVFVGTAGSSLLGGPWRWTSGVQVGADPTVPMLVLVGGLVAAFIVWTCLRRRGAVRAWLFLFLWLLFDVALLAATRLSSATPGLGGYYRYVADAAIPITVMLGFALLPTRAERAAESTAGDAPNRDPGFRALVVVTLAFLASVTISQTSAFHGWSSNPAKAYVAHARLSFGRAANTGLLVQDVPEGVLSPLFTPFNRTETVLTPIPGHPRFEESVARLIALDHDGDIRPGHVVGRTSATGPEPGCGWRVSSGPVRIPLRGDPDRGGQYVRIVYRAPAPISVRVGDAEAAKYLYFDPARHEVFVRIEDIAGDIRFGEPTYGGSLCVSEVVVGDIRFGPGDRRDRFGSVGR